MWYKSPKMLCIMQIAAQEQSWLKSGKQPSEAEQTDCDNHVELSNTVKLLCCYVVLGFECGMLPQAHLSVYFVPISGGAVFWGGGRL